MPWKPEYAANRRAKYQASAKERERRKLQGRSSEENIRYMRDYYKEKPEKFRRTPEQQAEHNARRRARYVEDAAFREKCRMYARQRDPAAKREGRLIAIFGITSADYDALLDSQGGGCAICGATEGSRRGERLAVDHCHAAGHVRGILCSNCNQGLGKFKDDIERLCKAIEYLRRC